MVHCFYALSSNSRCAKCYRPTWLCLTLGHWSPKGEEFLCVSLEFQDCWYCGQDRGDAHREWVCWGRGRMLSAQGTLTSLSQESKGRERSQGAGAWALVTGSDHIWADRFPLTLAFWKLEKHTNTYATKQMFPCLLPFLLQHSQETHVCVVLSPVTN